MKKIKIGQIGVGHDHAALIFSTLRQYPDVFDLVGYAIPEDDDDFVDAHRFEGARRMTVEELLAVDGLQAVTVETCERQLTKYAKLAADRGLAVHMDKPGGLLLPDFEELISTVKEKGIVFHTGYMYRYNPVVEKLRRQIAEGKLGEIHSVEAHMDCHHTDQKRQWLGQFPGGMMFFLGCHLIDLCIFLRGFPDEIVPYNAVTGVGGVTAEDYGFAVLKYKNGVSFVKTSAAEIGGFMRRQLVVCGSKGTVQLLPIEAFPENGRDLEHYTGVREVFDEPKGWGSDGERYDTPPFQRYGAMMRAFAAYVAGERENPFTPDYELKIYRALLAACGQKI